MPIPPHLVAVLREHLATFGTADDGRLFFSEKGSVVPSSPLESWPYDLRHWALSM